MAIHIGIKKKNYLPSYSHLDGGKDGWYETDYAVPFSYDLCLLMDTEGTITSGWWTGNAWDGAKLTENKIVRWKKLNQG